MCICLGCEGSCSLRKGRWASQVQEHTHGHFPTGSEDLGYTLDMSFKSIQPGYWNCYHLTLQQNNLSYRDPLAGGRGEAK